MDAPDRAQRLRLSRPSLFLLGVLLLAACTQGAEPGRATSTAPPPTATLDPSSPTGTPEPTTDPPAEPVTTEGDCRYLETEFVEQTVGQRITRTTYTSTSHELLPGCTFYRPDGDPAVDVAVTGFPSEVEAQTAAIEQGTAAANPVDDIADGGVVLVDTERAVLAVTSGRTLLVVTINQASSLEARAIAEQVAPLLGG